MAVRNSVIVAPNLPEYQQDSMDEFFEDVKFLQLCSILVLVQRYDINLNVSTLTVI